MAWEVRTDYEYDDGQQVRIEVGTRSDDARLHENSIYLQVGYDQMRVLTRPQAFRLARHLMRALETTI